MNITISKSLANRVTTEQVEAALRKSMYKIDTIAKFKVVKIKGDALDTATGKALHSAIFSDQRREVVINAYPADGSDYKVFRVRIG